MHLSRGGLTAILGLLLFIQAAAVPSFAGAEPGATITVFPDEQECEVNRLVFGQFIEHLGMCIKDGLWTPGDENHELVLGGVRKDVYEAIDALNMPMLRWPGGCFSDGYHWKDGIGPADGRPLRKNLAWARGGSDETPQGPMEDNAFGTDEFLRLCEALGTEPLINVNLGSGTAEEAHQWVEYVNGSAETEYGRLRAENGHPEPYGVKYWGVGNESWGSHEIGYFKNGSDYAEKYLEFARAMKSADPDIELLAVGGAPILSEWNEQVLQAAGAEMDFLSVHIYFPGLSVVETWKKSKKREYYGIMAAGRELEEMLDFVMDQVDENAPQGSDVRVALDEWNLWWSDQQIVRAEDYDFASGLFTADVLMRMMGMCDRIAFANFAQLVNVLGLVITDPDGGIYVTPSYYMFELFSAEMQGDRLVRTEVESPVFSNHEYGIVKPRKDNPYIMAAAVTGEGTLEIIAINKHHADPITASVRIEGQGTYSGCSVRQVTAPSPQAMNTFEKPDVLEGITGGACPEIAGPEFKYGFPPHSVTMIRLAK